MATSTGQTVVCLASFEKGYAFLEECKQLGWRVILVTVPALEHVGWPRESVDELHLMPDLANVADVIKGVSYLARTRDIARIVPLDDYDVETAAALREHLRLPGMGLSQARLFRDKLAMRVRASEADIPVPGFVHVLNHDAIREFTERVPAPWVLKPRSEVSTIGIAKIESADELWPRIEELGDRQSCFVLERFVPGDVCHVDALVFDGEMIFAEAHQYARPPLEVFHGGGIAMTRTIPRAAEHAEALRALAGQVLAALGMWRGAVHVEFIRGRDDGQLYFLEAGARVGGANTAEMVEAATGINLWREWAKIALTPVHGSYVLPHRRSEYGGVIVTLARQEYPNTSGYQEPEIVWRMEKHHHVGFVLRSTDPERVTVLLDEYARRFDEEFHASLPPITDPKAVRDAHLAENAPQE
ncbi:MAG TPA: ATP-grasp domain-containing protein [Ktedonobacterales bacterium]|nr:ATP-grasp domain-containing protein [Ktedonobacterales bacterium]